MINVIRVFPRKTTATPNDELVRFDEPGLFEPDNISKIHISVTFTYDMAKAENLYHAWNCVYPGMVKIGGAALNEPECILKKGMS